MAGEVQVASSGAVKIKPDGRVQILPPTPHGCCPTPNLSQGADDYYFTWHPPLEFDCPFCWTEQRRNSSGVVISETPKVELLQAGSTQSLVYETPDTTQNNYVVIDFPTYVCCCGVVVSYDCTSATQHKCGNPDFLHGYVDYSNATLYLTYERHDIGSGHVNSTNCSDSSDWIYRQTMDWRKNCSSSFNTYPLCDGDAYYSIPSTSIHLEWYLDPDGVCRPHPASIPTCYDYFSGVSVVTDDATHTHRYLDKSDSNVEGHYQQYETLYDEYTTDLLITRTEAALPAYDGIFYSDGICQSFFFLSDQEDECHIARFIPKFTIQSSTTDQCICYYESFFPLGFNPTPPSKKLKMVMIPAGSTEAVGNEVLEPSTHGFIEITDVTCCPCPSCDEIPSVNLCKCGYLDFLDGTTVYTHARFTYNCHTAADVSPGEFSTSATQVLDVDTTDCTFTSTQECSPSFDLICGDPDYPELDRPCEEMLWGPAGTVGRCDLWCNPNCPREGNYRDLTPYGDGMNWVGTGSQAGCAVHLSNEYPTKMLVESTKALLDCPPYCCKAYELNSNESCCTAWCDFECPCIYYVTALVTVSLSSQCFTDCSGHPCDYSFEFSEQISLTNIDLRSFNLFHQWVIPGHDVALVNFTSGSSPSGDDIIFSILWHFQDNCCGAQLSQNAVSANTCPFNDPHTMLVTMEDDLGDGAGHICGHATSTVTLTIT